MSWIELLSTVPEMTMLDYLPAYLEGLFTVLSDPNREIRQAAENILSDFLNEMRERAVVVDLLPLVDIVVRQREAHKELLLRLTAVHWLHAFIDIG